MSPEQNAELITTTWQSIAKGDAEAALANARTSGFLHQHLR